MIRTAAIVLLTALCTLNATAEDNNPSSSKASEPGKTQAAQPAKDATQDPGLRKLSRRERKEAIRELTEKYRDFLDKVEPIILPDELNAFLLLESDAQRDVFIDEFWLRRDPDPKTSYNEYEEDYQRRLEVAKLRFKYLSSERSRFLLINSEPDEIIDFGCERYIQPTQIWIYSYLPGFGERAMFVFYYPKYGSDYILYNPVGTRDEREARSQLISRDGEQSGYEAIFFGEVANGVRMLPKILMCLNSEIFLEAIGKSEYNKMILTRTFTAPQVDQEGVAKIFDRIVMQDATAAKISAELSVRFPGKRGARVAAEMTLRLKRAELTPKELEGSSYYNVDVVGEILKEGKMFETFRYRYDYPADGSPETIPVIVERYLRPNTYLARMKVIDVNANVQAVVEQLLEVPYIQESAEKRDAKTEAAGTIDRMQTEIRLGESQLKIAPLADDILTGLQQIEAMVSGDAIKVVEFYLDGKKVMSKRAPPFRLDLDFGEVPRTRNVRAVGLDEKGSVVAGDDLTLNVGTDPFRVRIASPRVAMSVSGPLRVAMEASVPENKELERIELFFNETRLSTLYTPPFVATINVPPNKAIGYLRAVAYLKDDTATAPAEDIVFINTPDFMQNIQVLLVELPTSVINNKGHHLTGLSQQDFQILDEKKPVEIAKFEYQKDLPLSLGMAFDTSGSMRPRLTEAQRAGFQFFRNVLRPGDKAFLLGFDSQALVIQKWTDSLAGLNAGLASLRAEEATALYDAIVFSLYNFKNVKGQKALVVISDGKDTASRFTFDQAAEYARRTAVPIYIIAIGIKTTEIDTRYKMGKFAADTGGDIFYIEKASDLERVYDSIHTELRAQYLLGFYPPGEVQPGGKWREVSVRSSQGKARTIAGYYP
ncbi:MAG: VWA domain-containing protein [Acidobacteria bacterium]|nr:VWA domain-containing protein [Acidobacteriota bacterium]